MEKQIIHASEVGSLEGVIKFAEQPKVESADNAPQQRDEILLCGLTGVKCGNRIRVCKLEFGRCSGQRKTSPVV